VFALTRRGRALEHAASGRRAAARVRVRRGKYARHSLSGTGHDIAADATLRAAAARRARRFQVEPQDLRHKLRQHRSPLAACIVVDNSYSLQAERMVEKVKGLTLRLLEDAAGRGDRVALVAFKGGVPEATVALPLTRSLRLAERRLARIPLSGRTPLADALARARRLLRQEQLKHANAVPLVIAVTDGLPTVALRPGGDPLTDAIAEARRLRRAGIGLVVLDAAVGRSRGSGCGPELARAAGGVHLPFDEVVTEPALRA
jgi:magnesium chelatase subunit D